MKQLRDSLLREVILAIAFIDFIPYCAHFLLSLLVPIFVEERHSVLTCLGSTFETH